MTSVTGQWREFRYHFTKSTLEGTMRKLILLIAATALFLCSISVWAGGSQTETTDDAAVFVISNAL